MVSTYVLYMYVYGHTILAAGEYCKGESMDGGGGGLGHYMHGMCKHELALSTLLYIKFSEAKNCEGRRERA